ncbi:MAG: hypothetical protein U5K54_27570 [Cytophagales bacterium]|nr:hypothetical protein [Cytophagales bacterium]
MKHILQTIIIGFLENAEGEWIEFPAQPHTLKIGIGRLPVKTSSEAQAGSG